MDQSNDRFVSFDITDETAVKAELDDFYYIEFYSFFSEGKQYDLSSETATDLLQGLVEGYALRLIPAFCDEYCYRVGPFSSSEETEEFFLMIQSDIENKNQNGSSLQIGIRTVSPTSASVLLRKILLVDGKEQSGEPIFSFAAAMPTVLWRLRLHSMGTAKSPCPPIPIPIRESWNSADAIQRPTITWPSSMFCRWKPMLPA